MGTSGGSADSFWNEGGNLHCISGTLGALLTDANDVLYILSNSHVLDRNFDAAVGAGVTQPGLVDTVPTVCLEGFAFNIVATLATGSSLADTDGVAPYPHPDSNVDAAVGLADPNLVDVTGAILGIGTINPVWAEVGVGEKVTKSGRTTGVTTNRVDAVNATISVGYGCNGCNPDPNDPAHDPNSFAREFTGQIIIKNPKDKFIAPGDSGSVALNAALQPVGLLFAGGNVFGGSGIAVANPAADVLSYFNDLDGLNLNLQFCCGAAAGGTSVTQPATVARAIEVQEANAARLGAVPNGVGHGVSVENGVGIIKVYVEQITPQTRQAVPNRIDGVPVVLEAVGRVVGY